MKAMRHCVRCKKVKNENMENLAETIIDKIEQARISKRRTDN